MLDLTVSTKKANWDTKQFDESTTRVIVASTKSKNKYERELAAKGEIVGKVVAKELFLDREMTEKAVDKFVSEQIKEKELAEMVSAFVKEKLNGACLYEKSVEADAE